MSSVYKWYLMPYHHAMIPREHIYIYIYIYIYRTLNNEINNVQFDVHMYEPHGV